MDFKRVPEQPPAYSFRHKIVPFLKGFMTGGPLAEVALEGLRRGVDGAKGKEYESRLVSGGGVHQICEALARGMGEDVQLGLARAMRMRFNQDRAKLSVVLHPGIPMCIPSALAYSPRVSDLTAAYRGMVVWKTMELLESGAVTSGPAQAELAGLVSEGGNAKDAARLLDSVPNASEEARGILRQRLAAGDR